MILTTLPYKVYSTGAKGSRQGRTTIPARVSKYLGWKDQSIHVLIFKEDEEVSEEKVRHAIDQIKRIRECREEVEKLKEKFFGTEEVVE